MSTESVPPPRVARAAERADLGSFLQRHERRTRLWRLVAEMSLLLPPSILLFADWIARPDGAWNWLPLPVMLLTLGVGFWGLTALLNEDRQPRSPQVVVVVKLALYAALFGGYLAWQWHLGWPHNSFGIWLTVSAVTAAVLWLAVAFDVLFVAYVPRYTFREGLVLGNPWGGPRRVVRYADVTDLWYETWTTSMLDERFSDLGAVTRHRFTDHHWHRLRLRRGRGLRIKSTVFGTERDSLGWDIRYGIAEAQVPGALAAIKDGAEVRFGPITADRDGIRAGAVSLPWERVKNVTYYDRELCVDTTDDAGGLTFRARRVPNGETLASLCRELEEERRRDSGKRKEKRERNRGKRK